MFYNPTLDRGYVSSLHVFLTISSILLLVLWDLFAVSLSLFICHQAFLSLYLCRLLHFSSISLLLHFHSLPLITLIFHSLSLFIRNAKQPKSQLLSWVLIFTPLEQQPLHLMLSLPLFFHHSLPFSHLHLMLKRTVQWHLGLWLF